MKSKTFFRQLFAAFMVAVLLPAAAIAQNSSSSNYEVYEAQFGSGGIDEQCSTGEFCAQGSLGANAVGRQSSDNFNAEAGALTQNAEFLEFVIDSSFVDFGELTPSTTGTGTVNFYVRSYISSGYNVLSIGEGLSSGTDEIDALSTTGLSQQGTEQFGINVVDNTSPDIGADPENIPDGSFADGRVSSGYNTVDEFRFVSGEPIAEAPATAGNQGVGRTNYTVSYIANVGQLTPAGTYTVEHSLVAVPTF